MPDIPKKTAQRKLGQKFEQLPDAAPPFGLDTRIKAQARTELEQRSAARARQRRLGLGFATTACAVLAVVIARPLLQQPLEQHSYDLPQQQPLPAVTENAEKIQRLSRGIISNSQVQPQLDLQYKARSSKAEIAELKQRHLLKRKCLAAMREKATMELSAQPFAAKAEAIAPLEELLKELHKHQKNGDTVRADAIIEQIERHYPDHRLLKEPTEQH